MYQGKHLPRWLAAVGLALIALPALAAGDLLKTFDAKTNTFTLDNGLTFIVVERHQAPVVSFATYADVGYVNEPMELAGIAHMFEHMAFKGTTSLGSKDIQAELAAIKKQEQAYLALRHAKLQRIPDEDKIAKLQKDFDAATEEARKYANGTEFSELLQRNGATGLNATTAADRTMYFYSLPSNRVELFFALEADRFIHPVLREFYTERDVVMEERRMRYESQPVGRLLQAFLTTAFKASHYGIVGIGYDSTIQNYSRSEAEKFFKKFYVPSNLTIAVVGDVDSKKIHKLAEQYFGSWDAGAEPPPVRITEPEQLGEKTVTIRESTQPFVMIGYHRPSMYSPDDAAYAVLADILGTGRTSRFHKQLVESKQALVAQVIPSFPGSKFASLFTIFAAPNQGVSAQQIKADVLHVLKQIKTEGVTAEELERAKTRIRADLIGSLGQNQRIANMFARAEALTGDWREVFTDLDEVEAVTAADIKRIANETFKYSNRTVGMIVPEQDTDSKAKAGGSEQ